MRILIVEDHPDLRELLASLLTAEGHEVVSARDGAEALRIFTEGGDFDYVVTDYQMPRMNGVVLIVNIRRAKPGQNVVLVSGDPPTLPDHIREATGEFPVLRKPYRNADLLALLT
jgi:CheY-like chemotaxis protein